MTNKPTLVANEMTVSGATVNHSAELQAKTSLTLGDGITVPVADESGNSVDRFKVSTDGMVTVTGGTYTNGFIGEYLTDKTETGRYSIRL